MTAKDLRDKTPDQLREELANLKKKRASTCVFSKPRAAGKYCAYARCKA